MEVWTEMQLLVNITARSPRLLARGLPPGQVLFLRVYSSNSKGRSRSVRVEGYTLRKADHHIPGESVQCKTSNRDLYFGTVTIMNDIFDLL